MGATYITDMTHLANIPPGLSHEPARKLADFLGTIVSAATVSPADTLIEAALFCRRRPGRVPCPGHMQLYRDGVSGRIDWHCSCCDEQGLISNWQGTSWDMSRWAAVRSVDRDRFGLIVVKDELVELRRSLTLSPEEDCMVMGAVIADDNILLIGTLEEFEDLAECVAADANHEDNRRRQRILDRVSERIEPVLIIKFKATEAVKVGNSKALLAMYPADSRTTYYENVADGEGHKGMPVQDVQD